jgi:small-conductance mechanosensitive channel
MEARSMDQIVHWLNQSGISIVTVLATIVLLAGASIIIVLINRLLRRLIKRAEPRLQLPRDTLIIANRVATGSLWFITALLVLSLWGVSVGGLWTLLVSAAAVVGVGFLAVWTMISNVTAGLFITLWRPFHLGQTVELLPENLKGRVIDRNMMFTSLREEGGSAVRIPNNLFFQKMFRVSDGSNPSFFEYLEGEEGLGAKSEQG